MYHSFEQVFKEMNDNCDNFIEWVEASDFEAYYEMCDNDFYYFTTKHLNEFYVLMEKIKQSASAFN